MSELDSRTALAVGDILRVHGDAYRAKHPVTPEQAQVMRRLADCRTAALGGHVDACTGCGWTRISYNSCRDRHCPKCQAGKRAAWLETRLQRLLPVGYFHVVFTLPDILQPLILHNQRRLYQLLFQAASATLLTLAADPQRLGRRSVSRRCCTPGGRTCAFIPTYTASLLVAAWRSTANAGLLASRSTSCP